MISDEENEHTFKSDDFSKKKLSGRSFSDCSFEGCDFTESDLRSTRFNSCLFKNCNFTLTKIDGCRLQDVHFIETKILGVDFYKCDPAFFSVRFNDGFLQYCNFSDLNMKRSSFKGCKLKECHFTNTVLKEANFMESDLLGTIFHDCDLSAANFTGAFNYNINPQTSRIKKAKFTLPEALSLLSHFEVIIK